VQGGADTSSALSVDQPQLGDVRKERLIERMLHAFECLFYRQAVQIYLKGTALLAPGTVALDSTPGSHGAGARLLMSGVEHRDLIFRDHHCESLNIYHQPTAVPYLAYDALSEASLHRVTRGES
jgi:hypothetical protein